MQIVFDTCFEWRFFRNHYVPIPHARWPSRIFANLFGLFDFISHECFSIIWLSNLLILSLIDEGYSETGRWQEMCYLRLYCSCHSDHAIHNYCSVTSSDRLLVPDGITCSIISASPLISFIIDIFMLGICRY